MPSKKFSSFVEIVRRLRAPDGCPWDRKQTPQTFKKYLLEETHELLEAINSDNRPHIKEELGDLLFQLVFLASLYEEKESFRLEEVIEAISEKMIRRHPHVFGDQTFQSEAEMRKSWQAIKQREKREKGQEESVLESIPKSLPALRYAQRVFDRLARNTAPDPNPAEAVSRFDDLARRLRASLVGKQPEKNEELIGELLLVITNLARMAGTDAEEALKKRAREVVAGFSRHDGEQQEPAGGPEQAAPAGQEG